MKDSRLDPTGIEFKLRCSRPAPLSAGALLEVCWALGRCRPGPGLDSSLDIAATPARAADMASPPSDFIPLNTLPPSLAAALLISACVMVRPNLEAASEMGALGDARDDRKAGDEESCGERGVANARRWFDNAKTGPGIEWGSDRVDSNSRGNNTSG